MSFNLHTILPVPNLRCLRFLGEDGTLPLRSSVIVQEETFTCHGFPSIFQFVCFISNTLQVWRHLDWSETPSADTKPHHTTPIVSFTTCGNVTEGFDILRSLYTSISYSYISDTIGSGLFN